jgi:hypothetical protein
MAENGETILATDHTSLNSGRKKLIFNKKANIQN